MKRRTLLKTGGLAAANLALSGINTVQAQSTQGTDFSRPFKVPPLDTGERSGNQVKFNLKLTAGESNFLDSKTTDTMGINGAYLGPVLRARKGDQLKFNIQNHLNETATLHWHGFVLPAKMDGGPHQEIKSGETWQPEFEVVQAASTNWYHSHTHNQTGRQVYHGLASMFIVDDEHSEALDLPKEYGVDDVPVIIQDRAFNRNGSFRYAGSMHDRMRGMLGNVIMVNGVITPTLNASKNLMRLRILNASNARIYDLSFLDNRRFAVIAGDGGFLNQPIAVDSIRLAPAERAEILVDFSDGKDAILRNLPVKAESSGGMMGGMMSGMMGGGDEAFEVMRITAPSQAGKTPIYIPNQLITLPDWRKVKPANTRKMQLEMAMGPGMMMGRMMGRSAFSISGESMDMAVINFSVKANTFEVWELSNNSMLAHPFHIHNTQFQVLGRSGRPLAATERGLKDTVLVNPGEIVRVLIPFAGYTDTQTPYMYHCHILEHEDGGMMGQFTVT